MTFDGAMYEILQMPRYDRLMGRSLDFRQVIFEWIERLLDWIFSRLSFVFPDIPDINTGAVATIFVIVGGIVVVVAGLILMRSIIRARTLEEYDLHDIFEELADKKYTVADLINLSENAPNRRIGVRYRYIAVLLALNERQIIRIEPSATNAIILRQIKDSAPNLSAPFSKVAEAFHRAWFGHKEVSDEAFAGFLTASDTLLKGDSHEK